MEPTFSKFFSTSLSVKQYLKLKLIFVNSTLIHQKHLGPIKNILLSDSYFDFKKIIRLYFILDLRKRAVCKYFVVEG